MDPEYAKLMSATASDGRSAMPGPLDVARTIWAISRPLLRRNDKGIGIQLAYSVGRVAIG